MNLVVEPAFVTPDFTAIKQRQQATWASGDFAVIGTTLQIVGESLAEAADIHAGSAVLDVAAGNGNATLAAARRFANVTAVDYVPALLDKARQRAIAEGLEVRFQVADAEDLPFDDAASMSCSPRSARCLRPTTRDVPTRCCASCAPAAASVLRTGPRKASSAVCSR
jgi:SAM-dependent methyltransferase